MEEKIYYYKVEFKDAIFNATRGVDYIKYDRELEVIPDARKAGILIPKLEVITKDEFNKAVKEKRNIVITNLDSNYLMLKKQIKNRP
jgi:hypothetical protein